MRPLAAASGRGVRPDRAGLGRPGLRTALCVAALVAGGARVPRAAAQAEPPRIEGLVWLDALEPARTPPVSEVGLVLVEAVVTGADGRPIEGLTAEAFEVREDGLDRSVESFRPVDLAPPDGDAAPPPAPRVSGNVPDAREDTARRTFVLVFDGAHISPASLDAARARISGFLESYTRTGDHVVLVAPEGGLLRAGVMPEGRAALADAVGSLSAHREARPEISDLEAYLIAERDDDEAATRVRERLASSAGAVQAAARTLLAQSRERRARLLRSVASVLEALSAERTRKSVLLVSEGFPYEPGDGLAYEVIAASQRAAAAIEFVDVREDEATPQSGGAAARLGPATGAELLSSITGGSVVRGDPAAGFGRIGAAASHHYVLGYLPSLDQQGRRLRRIRVSVDQAAAEVQARRAYWYAPPGAGRGPEAAALDPAMARALASTPLLEDIPLRLTAALLGPSEGGLVEVAIVSEASLAALSLEEADDGSRVGELDVVLDVRHARPGESRTTGPETLPVRVPADTPADRTWVPFRRELALPPGLSQVKVAFRDRRSGAIGTVAHPIEIPDPAALGATPPILSDLPGADGVRRPRIVARRDFPRGSVLYCYFEVFPGPDAAEAAGDSSSYSVVDRRGRVRRRGALPLPERGADGRRRHLLEIPLARMEPGEYELVLSLAGGERPGAGEVRERFRVARPPAFDDDLYRSGLAAFVEGDFERAVATLLQWPPEDVREAARRLPAGDDALRRTALVLHTELAMLLRRHGLGERAEKHLGIARDLVEGEDLAELRHTWLLAAAFEYQQRELPAQALRLYDECARAFPDRGEARLGAGSLQERYAFLPEGFGRSNLSLSPRRAARAAEESYRAALRLDPELTEARLRLGRVLQLTERSDEAVEELEAVIAAGQGGPVVALAHLFRGQIAESRGHPSAAIPHYRAALEAAPELQVAALALAQALHRGLGRQAAAEVLTPALGVGAESPWLTYRRGPLHLSAPPLLALQAWPGAPGPAPE